MELYMYIHVNNNQWKVNNISVVSELMKQGIRSTGCKKTWKLAQKIINQGDLMTIILFYFSVMLYAHVY